MNKEENLIDDVDMKRNEYTRGHVCIKDFVSSAFKR